MEIRHWCEDIFTKQVLKVCPFLFKYTSRGTLGDTDAYKLVNSCFSLLKTWQCLHSLHLWPVERVTKKSSWRINTKIVQKRTNQWYKEKLTEVSCGSTSHTGMHLLQMSVDLSSEGLIKSGRNGTKRPSEGGS